jgi:LPS export ABC transporter protein LptC
VYSAAKTILRIASVSALAILIISCRGKLAQADVLDLSVTPVQTVDDMFAIQSNNGNLDLRLEALVMERYETDTTVYESFPKGVEFYGYSADGLLETVIVADDARHITWKKDKDRELFEAFGNVLIHNVLKQETMETDTIYWDRDRQEIHTDCYVKMYSPQGFMQGYGMRSDDRAQNAILFKPFNSYGYALQDTTVVVIDSVNFIGPLLKRKR